MARQSATTGRWAAIASSSFRFKPVVLVEGTAMRRPSEHDPLGGSALQQAADRARL